MRNALLLILALVAEIGVTQPISDTEFIVHIENAAFALGSGPRVSIDEVHTNMHTIDGLFRPFANLLEQDGFVVERLDSSFASDVLEQVEILVISNARGFPPSPVLPTAPAFTDDEVEAIYDWVNDGGALLLIADHMPFAGAVENLAMRFGIFVHNGYAFTVGAPEPLTFSLSDGSLKDHPISRGRSVSERIPFVATFGGHAFRLREGVDANPLMVFARESFVLLTEGILNEERQVTPRTPRIPAEGLFQGAALTVGAGRVFMSGEAAMFSAQLAPDGSPYGFNHPDAPHNAQFVLNVLHWLSGVLEEDLR